MALEEIPAQWRKEVCAILRASVDWTIRPTKDYGEKFQASFPKSTQADVDEAFLSFLEGPNPHGCPVRMDFPEGETWEFFFQFKKQKTYGKILLQKNHKRIVLFSAHLPKGPKLRCE